MPRLVGLGLVNLVPFAIQKWMASAPVPPTES